MASSSRANPPAKCHYFFKIILSDIVSESKMMIPKKFARKYGKNLADHVLLKAPYGTFWQVELERSNDKIWLHKGWQEFATHYSLCVWNVLVFRYEGDSLFHVTIFDKTASEIEYPVSGSHIDDANQKRGLQEGNETNEVDVHTASCEMSKRHPCSETEKSLVTYSRSCKKMRANSICEVAKPSEGFCISDIDENARGSSTKRMKAKQSDDPDKNSRKVRTKAGKATLESAKAYKSENPFSIVVMHRSYVSGHNMSLSNAFVERHLTKNKATITFQSVDGGTWPAKCHVGETNSKVSCGWTEFARDNHLVEGDVCVFELINRAKKVLKVVIFRARNNPSG